MKKVAIISSSVRDGERMSHRVALFLKQYIETHSIAEVVLLDLKAYDFPLFSERLAFQKEPSDKLLDFTQKFNDADALLIVTPVYNGSFPAALKNVIDLYFAEWKRKIVAIAAVTEGMVPPLMTIRELEGVLLKLRALVSSTSYTVINTSKEIDADGNPQHPEQIEKMLKPFIEDLVWLMDKIR